MGANKELSPDEQVRRVKAALYEAGYPDAEVRWGDHHDERGVTVMGMPGTAPPDSVVWRAFFVGSEGRLPCWPCWDSGLGPSCEHEAKISECPRA